ncbi:hypothetical protein BC831DRAFT_475909 [Entophlyctis helioformis]|nr:hypothetical protein BC831DRAFT_475909 [Entophlyctis helioformis]
MSAVVRELWGKYPSFLKLRGNKTLLDLVEHLPNHGAGVRVAPSVWHQRGKQHSWYEVDRIEYNAETNKSEVFGLKVVEGVRSAQVARIGTAFTNNWRFYTAPDETRALERKLGVESA